MSPLFAELLAAALEVARRTEGRVDPTVGAALVGLGYDRDYLAIAPHGAAVRHEHELDALALDYVAEVPERAQDGHAVALGRLQRTRADRGRHHADELVARDAGDHQLAGEHLRRHVLAHRRDAPVARRPRG